MIVVSGFSRSRRSSNRPATKQRGAIPRVLGKSKINNVFTSYGRRILARADERLFLPAGPQRYIAIESKMERKSRARNTTDNDVKS